MLEEEYNSVYIPNTTDPLKDENKKEKKNRKKTMLIAV
jgi:hypothetical protein